MEEKENVHFRTFRAAGQFVMAGDDIHYVVDTLTERQQIRGTQPAPLFN